MRFPAMVVLAKRETTYGLDASPTALANAMLFQDVDWTPMEAEQVERPMVLPWYGARPVSLVARRARLQGNVDLAGSGAAGTVPGYATLLRACGLAEAITADTRVDYTPVSSGEDAATLYHNVDGVRQAGVGARGTFNLDIQNNAIPRIRFDLQALYVAPSAVSLPAPTLTGFQDPLPVSDANTPTATIDGQDVKLRGFTYTHGNQVVVRDMPNQRAIRITGRTASGTIVIEEPDGMSPDFFSMVGTRRPIQIIHGTVAGNICQVDLAQARLLNPRRSNENGISMLSFDLRPEPSGAGNDEFRLRLS